MKLRNKKTGEIEDLECITIFECSSKTLGISESIDEFYTIAELNEKWEDYKPKEPLLKDYPDEMRAIRAYGYSPLTFFRQAGKHCSSFNICTRFICFNGLFENLKDGETYTLAELCGEEETPEPKEPSFIDLDERIREKAATEKLYEGENDMHLREEEE